MSEWKEYKLGELVETLDNQRIPLSSMERAQRKGIYRYYGAQGVIDYIDSYIFDGKYMLVAEDGNNIKERKENIALIAEGKYWVNNHAHILKSNGKCDLDLVCYIINQMDISGFVTGTAQPKLNQANLMKLPLYLPDLPTQQRIASILSSLDAKIENNNKINAKLEEIAQNLFKEWFVDFGPFKNGKFVESELGLIPEGWRVGTLGEVCAKITDGSHFSPQNSDKDNIPMLSVKDMEEYGFNYKSCKHISKEDYLKLKDGDCVPLVDDILVAKDGSYLKEIFICDEFKEQAILSSIAIFRPKREIVFPDYLLGILKSPKVMKDVKENYVSGSAVPRIVLKDFKKLPILVPTYTVQSEFTDIYNSCRKQIYNNCKENQRLATLRDTLLPKLMSGEIEV